MESINLSYDIMCSITKCHNDMLGLKPCILFFIVQTSLSLKTKKSLHFWSPNQRFGTQYCKQLKSKIHGVDRSYKASVPILCLEIIFVYLFALMFNVPVNNHGHIGTLSPFYIYTKHVVQK